MAVRRFLFIMLGFVLAPISHGSASEQWILPLEESSWRTVKVPGTLENNYSIGDGLLKVWSSNSASFRYFELPGNNTNPSQVNWRWRVESYSNLSRQSDKGRDDRPLAVHLWFDDSDESYLFRGVGSLLRSHKDGHLLTYVWGAEEATGSIVHNPYYAKGRVIVLVGKDAPTGEWRSVQRNIARDFKAAFGSGTARPRLRYIAISADNDDLGGQSVAALQSLSIVLP